MANPFDQFDNTVQTGPVYGLPLHPPQQTPDQATGQSLQNVHTQLENQTIPLQQANTKVNIAQGQASIASTNNQIRNTNLDNVNNLRKQFETEQSTQDYKTVLPLMDSALKIQNNKAGDLNLVYAFGKAMDPGSVVREGEQVMATNVGGVSEKVKGYIDQINGQGQLTPVQRTQLIEELRNRSRSLQETYNQRRSFYEDFAKRNGINPNDVVGPHPGQPYQGDEAAYIQAHGGTPKIDGNPIVAPTQNEGHYGDERGATPLPPHSEEFRNGLYSAMRSGKIKSTADMTAWTDGFNAAHGSDFHPQISAKDTERAIQAAKSGRAFNVEQPKYNPDISDMRDGNGFGEKLDAGIRGAADTASFGLADKVAAAGDTLTQPNTTFDQNLARQYAISDYDTQSHFPSRLIGQIGGGLAMPMGEMSSVPQIALKSGAAGAAYGAGSSRSLGDMPLNALTGFGAGAALGAGLAGAGRGISALRGRAAQEVPPLIDPATGELNQPMDAMRPADRVQSMKDYGLKTVTPGMAGGRSARITEQALNNLPASAGHMEDVYSGASRELRNSMQGVAQKFGTSKTLNEGGSAAQSGTNEWMSHADRVDAKVYNAIPIAAQAPTTNSSTIGFLQQITSKFESNPALQNELKDQKLAGYLSAIQQHGLNWQDLKDFRSYIGAKAGQFRFSQDPLKDDYRGLYGALSDDMRASAAAQGPQAIKAFERANAFHAAMENRIEGALVRILGNDAKANPERAAAAIQAMTMGGKAGGDLKTLAAIKSSTVKSGAWDEIASTLIHLGGQPAKSEGRAFQPATFVNWYADMSEPARAMLFKPELRKSLDGFVAMNQQLSRIKALNNTSNTGALVLGGAQLLQFGKMIMSADLTGIGIQAGANGANYILGKLWTTPKFVSLITGYGRAVASGNQNAVRSQIGRIGKLAATNPELREPLIALQQRLLKGANDNAMMGAAASQSNSEEN